MSGRSEIVSDAAPGPRQAASLARLIGPQGVQLVRLFDCVQTVQVWIKDCEGRYLWVNRAFLMHYSVNNAVPRAGLRPRNPIVCGRSHIMGSL